MGRRPSHRRPPHSGVYARLGVSSLHGIGVIAVREIPKGTYPFSEFLGGWVKIKKAAVDKLAPEIRKMYHDFYILRDGYYEGARDMNWMDASFYLNNSKDPNMGCDKEDAFYALRKIDVGEELTVDYDTYSEQGE